MYTGSEYNDMWVWAARAAPGRVGAGRCARWAVHRSSASSALLRQREEEEMKRILAVLAIVCSAFLAC
jgi:hypothetical protein